MGLTRNGMAKGVAPARSPSWVLAVAFLAVALGLGGCFGSDEAPEREPITEGAPSAVELGGVSAQPYEPAHDKPGPAAERVFFQAFDVDRAPKDLEAGRMDLYMFSLKTAAAEELADDERVNLYQAPATTLSLVLNPAPAQEGKLNPFSIKEIRQAMQYLVDRDFIARDIFRGRAFPMVSHVSPIDFDFLTVYDVDRGSGISYDPQFARDQIKRSMEEAGAELVDDVWQFEERPVRLTLIGRVEDERRDLADLIRAELERAGFQIAVSYQPFAPAVLRVYSTDPQVLDWHIYTEGWGRSAPTRYDFATVNQMTAPWLGNMPGWQEVGFWQYEHEELDTLGQQLFRGEFGSLEERNEIYRRMTELGLEESVRIWLATAVSHFPTRADLVGVTRDPVAGVRGPWTVREAYVPGEEELTVGNLWVWTERTTWNPVGGFGDVYSVDVWRNLSDPPLWNHPFTGIPEPMRVGFELETGGPSGSLSVPPDAVTWDASADRWRQVEPGTTAVSKVIFDYSRYTDSRWHHGQAISMADVVYAIAQGYELAFDEDKVRIETALAVTSRPYLDTFRGYRVLDDARIEVYVDYWHFEQNSIASYASPTSLGMPWEILAAMDSLVFEQRRAAYSDTAAARFNVAWLSLVLERDARLVQRTLREFATSSFLPDEVFRVGGEPLVGAEEAQERYAAAMEWFDQYQHLVISNGPFFLARYDPPAQFAELQAFRDESYPFKPGDWHFGEPPVVRIEQVDTPPVARGEAAAVSVAIEGPGTLGLRYLLLDPTSQEVLESGNVQAGSGGEVALTLETTARLDSGFYRLFLAAYSDAVALITERVVDLELMP